MKTLIFILSVFSLFFLSLPALGKRTLKYALVREHTYWNAIDTAGNIIADSLHFSDYPPEQYISGGMFPVIRNGKLGFKNHHNKMIIPCIYSLDLGVEYNRRYCEGELDGKPQSHFINGLATIKTLRGRFGVVNNKGKLIVDTQYSYISQPDSLGIFVVGKGSDIKVVNSKGNDIVPFGLYKTDVRFFPFPEFNNGLLRVMNETWKVGFIDRKGKLVIDTKYYLDGFVLANHRYEHPRAICGSSLIFQDLANNVDSYYLSGDYYRFEGNRALVAKNGKRIVINTSGDSLFPIDGYAGSITNTGGFFIVNTGSQISGGEINAFGNRFGQSAPVQETRKWGTCVISPDVKMILEPAYYLIGKLCSGHFLVQFTDASYPGSYNFADVNGHFISKENYCYAPFDFNNGFAGGVRLSCPVPVVGDYLSFVDTTGRLIRQDSLQYVHGTSVNDYKVAWKKEGTKLTYGVMDGNCNWVVLPTYDELGMIRSNYIPFKKNGKWGYMDIEQKVLIPIMYDKALLFEKVEIP